MSLKKVIGISAGVIAASLIGLYAINETSENIEAKRRQERVKEVLESRESLGTRRVVRGDTYWAYTNFIGKHPCLKGVGTDEIIKYLKRINNEKGLVAGEDMVVPIYGLKCRKLDNLYPQK
ncbi:MAG: hypothetical protein AABY03_02665 [Nanoarchaeota archaeon]